MKPGSYLTEVEDMQSHLTGQPKLPDVARSYGSYDPPASEFASVLGVRQSSCAWNVSTVDETS